jgi:hypothetical protein
MSKFKLNLTKQQIRLLLGSSYPLIKVDDTEVTTTNYLETFEYYTNITELGDMETISTVLNDIKLVVDFKNLLIKEYTN